MASLQEVEIIKQLKVISKIPTVMTIGCDATTRKHGAVFPKYVHMPKLA